MSKPLDARIAIVTGAQQGIGRASAIALAEAGASVVVNYLDDAHAARAVVQSIETIGRPASAVAADVSKAGEVSRLIDAAAELGGVDLLVNNAGIFPRSPFLELTENEWDAVLGVNLKGTFLCSQLAARAMIAADKPGAIINITSVAALRSSPRGTHYVASKAGIIGLTRASALELAEHRIRVNAIAPGLTDTAQPRDGMSEAEIAETAATIPLGGITDPADIADAVVFLAGPGSGRMTGQTISVNGGQYLT